MSDTINPEGKQPNRGEKGKIASNVDGSPIDGVFDYGIMQYEGSAETDAQARRFIEEFTYLLEKKKDNINKVKNTKTKNTNKRKDNFICFCPYRN